jgi:RHS repeat-associated protein
MSKVENGSSSTFKRDGTSVVAPVLADGSANYTPGIAERRGTTTRNYHGSLKNLQMQTDTSQNSVASRTYDAFGNVLSSSGSWNGPFGYAGGFGYQEDRSGLMLLGHRYYDSSTGRFLTRDPIKDGRNWYAYGGGYKGPTVATDPSGLSIREVRTGKSGAIYWLWENAKDLYRAYDRAPEPKRRDYGQKNSKGDPVPDHRHFPMPCGRNIHHCTEEEADRAADLGNDEWANWRDRAKKVDDGDTPNYGVEIALLAFAVLMRDPVSFGEGMGRIADGATKGPRDAYDDWTHGGRAGIHPDDLWDAIY